MVKYFIVGCILLATILLAGCVQQEQIQSYPVVSPEETSKPVQESEISPEELVNESKNETISHTPLPTTSPIITPEPTTPVQVPTPDPNLAFQELVITKLDLIQEGKKAVLDTWNAGDALAAQTHINELRQRIRNNNDASTFPKKMDYVRLQYYDFIDRMIQFTDNFDQAAILRNKGESGSSNSYVSAGIMAGDRADISDKKIRVFLNEHPKLL
ncbi:hypothetical protein KSK55_14260 [Methanospirillum purgamenti]|uniref:Uncharacterized protein n=1 Tax=Methanospirillum hungatei TaxID=2203 RepID=A0A8F5ZFF5_METHU|nr:hypothetical protein [Methanospirillum hungatei]NLW77751.1 hypothetical protein [Methanomicrobiales archaeon]QXO94464.1 hypothetical protein KSK55_14260 [Methanospirillum hungatei]